MPWQEVSVMEQRREFVRLAMLEGANRRELCRRFGISRGDGYKWLRRWSAGETELRDRSRRPHRSPSQTDAAMEAECSPCAMRIRRGAHASSRAVWSVRALRRRRPRRCMRSCAATRVIETRGSGRAADAVREGGAEPVVADGLQGLGEADERVRCHPLTVVDDHSRYLVCLKACAGQTEATVRGHLETVFRHHGLPEAMFVDNGSPWGGGPAERWTRFGVWLLKLGVGVLHSRPYHPQSRGKNERLHRTLNQEVLSMASFRGLREAQRAFDAWLPIYNGERPHEALAMAVPADRYRPSPRADAGAADGAGV